jgi:probable HAF family extracellular repeat protein
MRHGISSALVLALLALAGLTLRPQRAVAASYNFIPINFPSAPSAGNPGFFGSSAFGVNNAGVVVGNWANPNTGLIDGFVYSNGSYTDVAPANSVSATLYSINATGTAVGEYQLSDNTIHAFSYAKGTITPISDFPGATETNAIGINKAGTIVGVYSTVNPALNNYYPFSAFVLTSGTYTAYNYPGAVATGFTGINDLGVIVGNYFDAAMNSHGFYIPVGDLNNPSAWVAVNVPGEPYTEPQGINNLGQIVGEYADPSGLDHGFVYSGGTNGTFSTLDFPNDPGLSPIFPGATGTELYGINDLGQIAGTYNNYGNGFLADPVPEPSTLALLALGGLGLVGWRRWKRKVA